MKKDKIIYMDHNATTPMHPEVLKAMEPFFTDKYGNASSLHSKGREAHAAVDEARTAIGNFLGTEAVDIIFTSGGTESDNMAIKGVGFKNMDRGNHIITSSIEHLAVLETCRFMQAHGFEVTYLPVDEYGIVKAEDVRKAITDKTTLVTIMHANNEVGTIQPIAEIGAIIKKINAKRPKEQRVYFHTDAVQSFGKIPVDVEELGVDLLSASGHKIYGPKGVGLLYIRKGTQIAPGSLGGHHERSLRAGTENVPGIVGFAKAVELAKKNFKENDRVKGLRDRLYQGLNERITDIKMNGGPDKRLSTTLSVALRYVEGEALLLNFDMKGICASTGSACTSGSLEQSHVLKAMGVDAVTAQGTVRFSLGLDNTDAEVDYCLKEIPKIVERLRSMSPLTPDQ
ncbi:MAG: cysteine desulfurase NifS [Candidatus Omnitrophica bacterium]|nr:cysteine desulfurase NifS [Candidatus Omnitrophota bacterium]